MVRMAGREVRHKNDISDRIMPSKIAVSSRMVTVASMVTPATKNSVRLRWASCCQRATSTNVSATSINSAASAAMGISASKPLLTATSASNNTAENTDASGVWAPASRLGMERFMEPHDT